MTGAYGFVDCIQTVNDAPRGSTSDRNVFAKVSFTMKPGTGLALSASANSRPRNTGIRRVRKYPGVTSRIVVYGRSLGRSSGVPRRWNEVPPLGLPIIGRLFGAATDSA